MWKMILHSTRRIELFSDEWIEPWNETDALLFVSADFLYQTGVWRAGSSLWTNEHTATLSFKGPTMSNNFQKGIKTNEEEIDKREKGREKKKKTKITKKAAWWKEGRPGKGMCTVLAACGTGHSLSCRPWSDRDTYSFLAFSPLLPALVLRLLTNVRGGLPHSSHFRLLFLFNITFFN